MLRKKVFYFFVKWALGDLVFAIIRGHKKEQPLKG
jgi:hypothetical protein